MNVGKSPCLGTRLPPKEEGDGGGAPNGGPGRQAKLK